MPSAELSMPAPRPGPLRLPRGLVPPLATLLALLALQELLSRSGWINARKFPPVSSVLQALAGEMASGRLWAPLAQTVTTWALALALSFVAAVVLGVALGGHRVLRALATPVLELIRPVPSTALIPLAVLTLGTDVRSALALTCFGTVWQILPSVMRGLQQQNPVALDTARAFGFGRLQTLRWVLLPALAPSLWTALRLGAAASLVLLISMEMLAGIAGLGHQIAMAYEGSNTAAMYAYILVASLVGGPANLWLTRFVQRRIALAGGPAA
jgi:ABC-type nitrate/sulfonate/bicarbonate transport system permease component